MFWKLCFQAAIKVQQSKNITFLLFKSSLSSHLCNFLTTTTETSQNSSKRSICSTDHYKCLDLSIRSLKTQILGFETPCQISVDTRLLNQFCGRWSVENFTKNCTLCSEMKTNCSAFDEFSCQFLYSKLDQR